MLSNTKLRVSALVAIAALGFAITTCDPAVARAPSASPPVRTRSAWTAFGPVCPPVHRRLRPVHRPRPKAPIVRPPAPITVGTLRPGDKLTSPVRVRGLANTFESTVVVRVVDDAGRTLALEPATARADIDRWGPFAVDLVFDPDGARTGTVVVFEESPVDGSALHKVTIPVQFAPFDDGD